MKEVNDFEIIPGKGVKGKIRNDELIAGNRKILNKTYETELAGRKLVIETGTITKWLNRLKEIDKKKEP